MKSDTRARILSLIENAKDRRQRVIRLKCLEIYDRWASGEPVDLAVEFARADDTDRDDCSEPVLAVIRDDYGAAL